MNINEPPVVSELLTPDNPTIQIYQTSIYVTDEKQKQWRFVIAHCYNQSLLTRNQSLRSVRREVVWHGDLMLIKQGLNGYADLQGEEEIKVAKDALKVYVSISSHQL